MFVIWIWLLISVFSDLFRRRDSSGVAKVIWVIFLIVLPYLGVFAYLLTQGGGIAERKQAQASKAREEMRNDVGFSAADEIRKLDELKAQGSIADAEYREAPRQADLTARLRILGSFPGSHFSRLAAFSI